MVVVDSSRVESASQTSESLGVTNYINADGTSSDCCIYREIAPPSFSRSHGPRHIKRMETGTRRRLREAKGDAKKGEAIRKCRGEEGGGRWILSSASKDAREEEYVG